MAVNTTDDIDTNYQLNALTDKCIQFERSLMEEQKLISEMKTSMQNNTSGSTDKLNFHSQILLEQLNNAKSEILNLKGVIDCLQSDKTKLANEVHELKNTNQRCLRCFPTLNE